MSETKGGHATLRINPPLKWHIDGGKHDLAKWIISKMPRRCQNPNAPAPDDPGYLHYCEPYAGGLSVLLANDPEGISEVVNDLNGDLVNFWRHLQDPVSFEMFRRRVEATPFGQPEFIRAYETLKPHGDRPETPLENAAAFFVCCRQSLAGRMKSFTGITKTRTRRGMNNEVSAWLSCIDGLSAVHERLKRVLIVGPSDALEVIRRHDGPRTLFYLDPPYLHETRATTGEYAHEMTARGHAILLATLSGTQGETHSRNLFEALPGNEQWETFVSASQFRLQGRFLLSGYRSALYDAYAEGRWTRHEMKINNHAAGGKTKRVMTECLWCGGGTHGQEYP